MSNSYRCLIAGRERTIDTSLGEFTPENTLSDHVPTLELNITDINSLSPVYTSDEIIILDDTLDPTANLLLNALFYSPLGSTTLTQPPPNNQVPNNSWTLSIPSGTGIATGTNPYGTTVILSTTNLNIPSMTQYTQKNLIADNMSYCLSVHLDTGSMVDAHAFIEMDFYATNAPSTLGTGGGGSSALLGSAYQQYAQSSSGEQRVSITGTAPIGTKYISVKLGILASPTESTVSCTFRAVQLEPIWFPDLQVYPTADCNQYSANCYVLPNNLAIRQNRVFAGIVVDTDIVEYDGDNRILKVGAKGAAYLLQTQFANGTYQQQYDSDILQQILNASTLPGRLTTYGVQQGAFIDERVYDDTSIEEVLNDFINTSNYTYYVTPYYDLAYCPIGTQPAYARLSDIDSEIDEINVFSYSDWSCPRDITQLANVINVHGAPFTRTVEETFSVSGHNYVTLSELKPTEVISVKVNGTEQTKGVYGNANTTFSTYQVLVDFPNHTIRWNANFTATVTVQYQADSQIKVQVRDVNSIALYGFEAYAKINDTNLTTTAAATQRGIQELAQRAYELVTPTFKTYMTLGAGQTVQITNHTELNADRTPMTKSPYLVTKSTPVLMGNGVVEYQIEAGADIPDYTRVNKRLHHSTARSKRLAGLPLTSTDLVLHDSVTIGQDTITAVITSYASRPGG